MTKIMARRKNLGKEILGLFVVFLHMKIILPIIKVMGFNLMVREAGFNLMVREVTASLKVLTFVSSLMRERVVKLNGDKDLFYLEGKFDKDILTVWVVHGYYTVTTKFVRLRYALLKYESEELSAIIIRFMKNPANRPFVGVEDAEVLKAITDLQTEASKWDGMRL
jgi:protein gp37